jgi:hypothetical protein
MRRFVTGICLLVTALGLVGCGAARTPQTVIAPSYSYVQADIAAGVSDQALTVSSQTVTVLASVSNKLPPLPKAPGFDTLVMVPTDTRAE